MTFLGLFKKKKTVYDIEFEKGNIILPTDLGDFENLEEFKEKSPPEIRQQIEQLENKNKQK